MKVNIIGCGLSGVTSAILLRDLGHEVEIFESREHVGGNCYDEKNSDGCTVHKYGSHIFHTNDEEVWNFLNRYTKFNNYEHRVRANTKEGLLSIPFNKKTADQLGRDLSPEEIKDLLFKDYSERHWGVPWEDLPKSISGRVPNKRDDYDDRYFTDKYQGIPENGYSEMFKSMLEGIKVNLGVDRNSWKNLKCDKLIWTGRVSEYFNLLFGHLPYRSLVFEHTRVKKDPAYSWDSGAVINECNTKPFNRTMDSSVYLNEDVEYTVHTRDFPEEYDSNKNDPIYPKTFGDGPGIYKKYKLMAESDPNTIFLGRLATYKYLDMWMAIKQVMVKLKAKGFK